MDEIPCSGFSFGLSAAAVILFAYRSVVAALLEALHALPSLQRRRLLEEEFFANPLLARLLEHPHALGLGVEFCHKILLVPFLSLLWPMRNVLPGKDWTFLGLAIVYIWAMDFAMPTLLVGRSPATWIARLFPFYAPLNRILSPLLAPFAAYVQRQREAMERARDKEEESPTDDAVTALLEEGEAEGILEENDRELFRNLVGFGDTVVREVMTPRTAIQALDLGATGEEVWAAFRAGRHSRMPVFDEQIDHVVGVLLLKDLMQLSSSDAVDLRSLLKEPIFVPESKPSLDLLRQFQRERTQIAIVVDEFGSVSGLVTVEDLLEEVFGEIREEHEHQADIQVLPNGDLLVDGQVRIEDLEERLEVTWEHDGFNTLAGLVMARLGHIPKPKERVMVQGASLTVIRVEGARILQVLLHPMSGSGPVR